MEYKAQIHHDQSINVPTHLKLSFYQKHLLTNAIFKGIEKGNSSKKSLFTKKHHRPLEYDLVNDEINTAVLQDKLDQNVSSLEITLGKAASHEYVKLFDTNRNISIIVCRLPLSQNNFDPSNYRAEHAYNNLNRLDEEKVEFELTIQEAFQPSMKFEDLSSPFGIIVFYDSVKMRIFEGAQTPSQDHWIYLDDISDIDDNKNIIPFTPLSPGDIDLPLKTFNDEDEEINIPLR